MCFLRSFGVGKVVGILANLARGRVLVHYRHLDVYQYVDLKQIYHHS